LAKYFYEKGIRALKVNNYEDALTYFAKAYTYAPWTEYGELAYLYYGKTYGIVAYRLGSKGGILASVGYLNQYTFVYKEPRYIELQREFIGDVYLLAGWYEDAQNVYASLYGASEKVEYLLKYAYASALRGDYEGYKQLRKLNNVPEDMKYLYYFILGIYHFDFGEFEKALEEFEKAEELNPLIRYDVHFNFYRGTALYKLGDKRRAMLYLERAERFDKLNFYENLITYYLINIYLSIKNFSDAENYFKNVKEHLFYNPLYQIAYSNLWIYEDAVGQLEEEEVYRETLLQLAWLNYGTLLGNYPLLGLYYFVLTKKNFKEEEEELIKFLNFENRPFVLERELFNYGFQISVLRKTLHDLNPYNEGEAYLLKKLYVLNKHNFFEIFGDSESLELLARALIYLGDREAFVILNKLPPNPIKDFLVGELYIILGDKEAGLRLIRKALKHLEGKDSLEAYLLVYLLEGSEYITDLVSLTEEDERFKGYYPELYKAVGDILYKRGKCREALDFYKKFVEKYEKGDEVLGLSLFKMAYCSEKEGQRELLEFVRKRAEKLENLWSDAILTLWGGG